MRGDVQNEDKLLLGGADPLYLSDKKGGVDDNISKNTIFVKRKGERPEVVVWKSVRTTRWMRHLRRVRIVYVRDLLLCNLHEKRGNPVF